MVKLKYKYAIGCLIQWYEIEMIEEYLQSVKNSLKSIDNKDNVIVDLCFNLDQSLEKIDTKQCTLKDIENRFRNIESSLSEVCNVTVRYNIDEIYTIADYRREFNNTYCEVVDILMWGETDSLIPKQTFEILDLLHDNNTNQNVHKYVTFFGGCKMWDDSWEPVEHVDFTDKPFIDGDTENWWGLRYIMNIDEMNEINNGVENLDVRVVDPYKFNGCGLVISSEVIKSGVNIPKSVFFVHEDTSFLHSLIKTFDGNIPQFIIKNILLVHNRKHPKKRMYVLGESGKEDSEKRKAHDWYVKANKMSEHNAYNMFNQSKSYTWEDVFE
tara:strand:- start:22 stop:999 length:978 start_codon:yes stop_codon:yes gene_type:complete